jgi:3-carboxy-cis,cis-muconate cycloisomerase
MRPSSSQSERHGATATRADRSFDGLLDGVLSRGSVGEQVRPGQLLQALLDVEAALARAGAAVGVVPADAARRISAACDATVLDLSELAEQASLSGNPVVPLVPLLRAAVGVEDAKLVHLGATSQDVMDTALVLVAARALLHLSDDLAATVAAAAALARRHRSHAIAGRTLMQQAQATTFGAKAALWLSALQAASQRLQHVHTSLPVQLGGPVGTLPQYGAQGTTVVQALADELGLAAPLTSWHTDRVPIADLTGALATVCGVVGKICLDVVLLSQDEVAEVREGVPGRGGSSSMAHKRNPVAAVSARAAALRAPGLAATLLAAMHQEHERGAGTWHAEWEPVSDLLRCTGSAVAWTRDCLEHLEVDVERMREGCRVPVTAQDISAAERLVDRVLAGML